MSFKRVRGAPLARKKKYIAHPAVAYAVTLGRDFAFFFVSRIASRLAVPSGICAIWLYTWWSITVSSRAKSRWRATHLRVLFLRLFGLILVFCVVVVASRRSRACGWRWRRLRRLTKDLRLRRDVWLVGEDFELPRDLGGPVGAASLLVDWSCGFRTGLW